MKAKRIAGYALIASPFVLIFAMDAAEHGAFLAAAKFAIVFALAGALYLGVKLVTE